MSDAFARQYKEHVRDVYGYLAYRLGSRADAEELTRETFERAFGGRAGFGSDRKETSVRLLTIAREVVGGREPEARENNGEPGLDAELAAALDRLERRERSVLALRYGAGLEGPEIARVLEISRERVRRAHSRGLRRLRTELERPQPGELGELGSVPAGSPGGDQQRRHAEQGEADGDAGGASEPPG